MAVMTKAALYARIDSMRRKYGICGALDPWQFADERGYTVIEHDFDDANIYGFLMRVQGSKNEGIVLNKNLTPEAKRYILAHELVHSELHGAFSRVYEVDTDSSGYSEYQADEGAAELLMPYREFVPKIYNVRRMIKAHPSLIIGQLAKEYSVDRERIRRRIKSLEYETAQYASGVPVERIALVSRYELSKKVVKTAPRAVNVCIDITAD